MPCMSLTFRLIIRTVYQNIQQCQHITKYFLLSLRFVELTDKNCYLVAFAVAKQKQDWDIWFMKVYQTEECGKCVFEDSSHMFSITQNMHFCADTKGKPCIMIFTKNAVFFSILLSFITIRKVIISFLKRHILKKIIWNKSKKGFSFRWKI